jgi:hypothetical protein
MQDNTATGSFLNVAASRNSNPISNSATDWFFFRFPMTEFVGNQPTGGDYPGLGVDFQAVYVTYNMADLPLTDGSSSVHNSQILILNKADLNRGVLTKTNIDTTGISIKPVSVLGGNTPGQVAYFVETPINLAFNDTVNIWAVVSPLANPQLFSTWLHVPGNGGAPVCGAPQMGTTTVLDTLAPHTQGNAFWLNGSVWFCHTAGGSHAIVYYYKVDLNYFPAGTPTLAESGNFDGGADVWNYQPAIGGNAQGDVCIVFSQSSPSLFPRIMFTARAAGAAGFEPPTVLKTSTNFYVTRKPAIICDVGQARWGDYATVAADPNDGSFWVCHEWAKSIGQDDWSTWWANISARPMDGVINVNWASAVPYPDGSAAFPFPRVAQANDVAYDGNTILMAPGQYPEAPIVFNKQLRIESSGPATIKGP